MDALAAPLKDFFKKVQLFSLFSLHLSGYVTYHSLSLALKVFKHRMFLDRFGFVIFLMENFFFLLFPRPFGVFLQSF